MEYFEKKRKFCAIVRKFTGKMVKAKQSKETARKKVVILTLDVKITKAMKALLPARVQAFLGGGDGGGKSGELQFNRVDCSFSKSVHMKIFPSGSFAGKDPEVDGDGECKLEVKKFFFVEEDEYMQCTLTCNYFKKLWAWGGEIFGDGEIVTELVPFQGELELDGDKKEEPEAVEA
jgi:hypothetical protein